MLILRAMPFVDNAPLLDDDPIPPGLILPAPSAHTRDWRVNPLVVVALLGWLGDLWVGWPFFSSPNPNVGGAVFFVLPIGATIISLALLGWRGVIAWVLTAGSVVTIGLFAVVTQNLSQVRLG